MATRDELGPFQAGDGGLPPYLAGREHEQDLCRAFMSRLRLGRPPPREIVFYGPRGNGKTALPAWLEKETAASPGVDVIRLVPAAIRTETRLVERLLSTSWWQHLTPNEISVYGIKWRPDTVTAARTALGRLGYVWRPETEPMWEAGIPNLMDYVQRYVPAPDASPGSVP